MISIDSILISWLAKHWFNRRKRQELVEGDLLRVANHLEGLGHGTVAPGGKTKKPGSRILWDKEIIRPVTVCSSGPQICFLFFFFWINEFVYINIIKMYIQYLWIRQYQDQRAKKYSIVALSTTWFSPTPRTTCSTNNWSVLCSPLLVS